jgi:hypothetical protein
MNAERADRHRPQIHIISEGKGMNDTFNHVMKNYRVDGIVIVREKHDESRPDPKEKDIDTASKNLFETAERFKIFFKEIRVPPNDINAVRNEILKLKEEHGDADFLFNLTHGKKVIPLYLFTMAVWIDGKPYYVEKNGEILEFNIPRMHADEMNENENLYSILSILHEYAGKSGRGMGFGDLYYKLSERYVPSRPVKEGRPPRLSKGTVSKWVRTLVESHLARAEFEDGSYKRKMLYLTNDGEFSYEFYRRQK